MIVPLRKPEEIYPRFDYGLTAEERKSDWLGKFGTVKKNETGTTLTDLKCPSCDKSKMWSAGFTPEKSYLVAKCHSCDHKLTHRDQFPERYEKDFFRSFEKKNPNVPFESIEPEEQARHYLASRGIPVEAIRPGAARVENIPWGPGYVVYFQDSSGEYLNGRVITPKEKGSKSYNKKDSQTGNKYFKATETIDKSRPVYVAEAPIKALALNAMGLQAISVYSSNFNEENKLFEDYKDYDLRGAFDNDDAGLKALKCFIEIRVKQGKLGEEDKDHQHLLSSNKEEDWDDYLKTKGTPKDIGKTINRWEGNAYIALAQKAEEWAERMRSKQRYVPPVFNYDGATYGAKVEDTKVTVQKFCDAVISLEARIIDKTDLDRESYSWALKIAKKGKAPKYIRNVGALEIKGESLETLLLKSAEVVFEADSRKWKQLIKFLLERKDVPEATRIDYAGYHLDSGYYLTPYWGVSKEGGFLKPDSIGSYKLKEQEENIIPLGTDLFEGPPKDFQTPENRKKLAKTFIQLFCQSYPMDGGLILTHAIAGIFSPLYKESGAGFPFLGLLGEPGSGKTDRVRMILEVFGVQAEGISLQSANKKGWVRELSHLSGGLYFMDEANDEDRGSFRDKISEFEEKAKSYYKKTTTQTQGARDNGNSVHKNYFRGSFIFAYNQSPWRTEAMRERTIEIRVRKEHLNIEGAGKAFRAWRDLTEKRGRVMAGIGILEAISPRIHADWKKERDEAQRKLREHFSDARVTEDMALLLAVNKIVREEFGIDSDLFNLEEPSPETGVESKIHYIINRHLAKVKGSNSSAIVTLVNALSDIGVIDSTKDDLMGLWSDEPCHFATWKESRRHGIGLFVYMVGMANDNERFPVLAREKEKIESELKRMSGVIPGDKQDMKTRDGSKISAKGYFISKDALRAMVLSEED